MRHAFARISPHALAVALGAMLLAPAAAFAADGGFKLRGYIHYDLREFDETVSTTTGERSELRRVRPIFEYRADTWSARVMPDLVRDTNLVLDAYIDLTPKAAWDLRIGRFKSPLSIDRLRSVNALALVEHSIAADMTPNRDNGVLLGLKTPGKSHWRLELGAFDGAADAEVKGSLDSGVEWTVRGLRTHLTPGATWRVGAGASFGDRNGAPGDARLARYRTQGRSTWFRFASDAYSNGPARRAIAFADYYGGPWFAQAELVRSGETVRRAAVRATLTHTGMEMQASRVLTGEARTPGGVTPANRRLPLLDVPVAVELGARLGEQRIDGNAFATGLAPLAGNAERLRQAGVSVGLWFPKQWRLTLDYEHGRFSRPGGSRAEERVMLMRASAAF